MTILKMHVGKSRIECVYQIQLELTFFQEALAAITEWTGAAVTTRGAFTATGKNPPPGERKLYLFIEGPTAESVSKAKKEIKRILEENAVLYHTDTRATGRYNVMS